MNSPYANKPLNKWEEITNQLVLQFPVKKHEMRTVVEDSFKDYLNLTISEFKLQVGKDIFFPAQATGVIIQKLITLRLSKLRINTWRDGDKKSEKDVVNIKKNQFSFEIKTSSSKSGIFGNRSMGHISKNKTKERSGYYLIINYKLPKEEDKDFQIYKIRFGWIDDGDWKGQNSPTGQQSTISSDCKSYKLVEI
jgi:hypothetical protein